MSKLVIVESPSKAKTIKKYLGSGFEVVASNGHVRDLPATRLSVDVKDHFKPKYTIIKGKEKLVERDRTISPRHRIVIIVIRCFVFILYWFFFFMTAPYFCFLGVKAQ